MAIHENSKVRVIRGLHDGRTGKVNRIYNDLAIAIVTFDDTGEVGKVGLSSMVEILAEEKPAPKIEFMPEGAKKISRDEFNDAIRVVTLPDNGEHTDFLRYMTAMIIGLKIADTIFKDEDVVVMTKDELIVTLWDLCNPKIVNEPVGKEMPISKWATISLSTVVILLDIIPIIFDGSEND